MAKGAHTIAEEAKRQSHVVMTIIPTKELAYAQRLAQEGTAIPARFSDLVKSETRNIEECSTVLRTSSDII
jgi:hypothetical protein